MSDMSSAPLEAKMVSPVPKDVPTCDYFNQANLVSKHRYLNEDGQLLSYVLRFETPASDGENKLKKRFCPVILQEHADGSRKWAMKAPPGPRSLYGRYELATKPDARALIVEGEKCADAAQEAFPDIAVVTWPGGSNGVNKGDFSPVVERDITRLGDNDPAGEKAIEDLIEKLQALGVSKIRVVDTKALLIDTLGHAPKGGDIADVLASGATLDNIDALPIVPDQGTLPTTTEQEVIPPAPSVHEQLLTSFGHEVSLPEALKLNEQGLTKNVVNNRGDVVPVFVASPIAVIGRSRTAADGAGWGKIVAHLNPLGKWETIVIPDALTATDGRELRELLARRGVVCGQCLQGRQALREYIAYAQPDQACVHRALRP